MIFSPIKELSEQQVSKGLKIIVVEGMAAEAMMTLTGGTFLVAIAIYLGATDFQLGLLAALPTLTNIFQLFSIWLIRKYNSRKLIGVFGNILGRFPLFIIGLIPLVFKGTMGMNTVLFILFFHYFFGSIAGAGWNSWMKDLVPPDRLSSYYSQRTRQIQILNVTLSLSIALLIDYIKIRYPSQLIFTYSFMFLAGGILGMIGVYLLAKAPEPEGIPIKGNVFELLKRPFVNVNFRRLLIFHAAWSFAVGIATPFITAYMIKVLKLPISMIISMGILSQFAGIISIRSWGNYADKFSNKTIIRVSAPLFIFCTLAWIFTANIAHYWYTIAVIMLINFFGGASISGINLALNSIVIKLAPKEDALVYLSVKNITIAIAGAIAPLLAGLLGDFFINQQFIWEIHWNSPSGTETFTIVELKHFRFLFLIGSVLAIGALQLLKLIKEEGEVDKDFARSEIRRAFRSNVMETMNHPAVRLMYQPYKFSKILRRRIRQNIDRLKKVRPSIEKIVKRHL